MFTTKLRPVLVGPIAILTSIWSNQLIKFITSACLNLVKQIIKPIALMSKPHVLFDIPFKSILVRPIKITIPPDTFQQHLPKMFFQHGVGDLEILDMPVQINVQNLCIVRWVEEQQLIELIKEFKDIFA